LERNSKQIVFSVNQYINIMTIISILREVTYLMKVQTL